MQKSSGVVSGTPHTTERAVSGTTTVFRAANVSFAYGAVPTLFGISLSLAKGELAALLGPNGAGKSTLLTLLAGLQRPSDGTIELNGMSLQGKSVQDFVRAGVVLVPDNKAVFPDMSVAENLEMSCYTLDRRAIAERAETAMAVFPRLKQRYRQQAGTMSGGERQMLSMSKALMLQPQVLLIDELTLGLAPVIVDSLLDAVQRLSKDGTTILLVEQSLNVAASICDRAIFVEKGQIAYEGRTVELLERPELTKAVLFGGHVGEAV